MSSSALNLPEVEAFGGALIADTDAGTKEVSSEREAPAFAIQGDRLYVSRAEGLRGAKGAMTAVGLEVAASFCFYGIWQLWHLSR
jgi:hypothetical protein